MAKTLLFVSALLAATGATAAPPAKRPAVAQPARPAPAQAVPAAVALPQFEFKGMRPDTPVDPSQLSDCRDKEGQQLCNGTDPVVAGIKAYMAPSIYLTNGKLSTLIYVFEGRGANTLTLLQALTEKYGKPCKSEVEKWVNRAGTSFDNPVWTWCFRTGKLQLHTMSFQRDYSDIWYTDDVNVPPAKPAKVDF